MSADDLKKRKDDLLMQAFLDLLRAIDVLIKCDKDVNPALDSDMPETAARARTFFDALVTKSQDESLEELEVRRWSTRNRLMEEEAAIHLRTLKSVSSFSPYSDLWNLANDVYSSLRATRDRHIGGG